MASREIHATTPLNEGEYAAEIVLSDSDGEIVHRRRVYAFDHLPEFRTVFEMVNGSYYRESSRFLRDQVKALVDLLPASR